MPRRQRSAATSPCSRRSRRSTGSRSAAATRPGSTCSCGATTSNPKRSAALIAERGADPLFQSGAVVDAGRMFVVRLQGGRRDRRTRRQHRCTASGVRAPTAACVGRCSRLRARVAVLGHTRWASVGIISEPNTHPLNSSNSSSPAATAALRRRGAERRRRQPRRPARRSTGCASPRRSPPTRR